MGKVLSALMLSVFCVGIVQADLGDIVRKGDPGTVSLCTSVGTGEVCTMTQYQADAYCRSQGTVLPTARELAVDSLANYPENLRSDRIKETGGADCESGYDSINTIETTDGQPNGQTDHFCFNSTGYQRSSGDLGNYWFWSSSLYHSLVPPAYSYVAYDLNSVFGIFDYHYRSFDFNVAVRCVR